jgi:hypothetical protein
MDETTRGAIERLLRIARSDTHQSRRVANFILAWWNAESFGGFDLADLFAVDAALAQDMARVFSHIAQLANAEYPTEYRGEIEAIIASWRPDVWAHASETV